MSTATTKKETTLNEAIINIQTTMDVFAKKTKRNTMGKGYDYFSETDLYNALKPLMKQEGVGYTIELKGEADIKQVNNMWLFASRGLLSIFKGSDRIELNIYLTAMNTDPAKAMGSALTYGARYWLCKEFGIATDELDPDTTEVSNKIKEAPKFVKQMEQNQVVETPKPVVEVVSENDNFVEVYCNKLKENNDIETLKFLMKKTSSTGFNAMKKQLKTLTIEELAIIKEEAEMAKEKK